ncbi:hypothetical protein B0T25DRAFT_513810 [Lasiosphaeria hispida]|uniref:Ubiquitin-like protease family profile domain-containing protein n=1 Tax=Lasiosphaeria hispida TaxID=260671 RepID=A0AAJ0HW06_9PEZI|nr:hypothetical protein B0T25DRAFT_513810 [Lasiosphaeria hispida]
MAFDNDQDLDALKDYIPQEMLFGGKLNDAMINTHLLNYLNTPGNVCVQNSFFYKKLSDSNWTFKLNVDSKNYFMVPVHKGDHWSLAIVKIPQQTNIIDCSLVPLFFTEEFLLNPTRFIEKAITPETTENDWDFRPLAVQEAAYQHLQPLVAHGDEADDIDWVSDGDGVSNGHEVDGGNVDSGDVDDGNVDDGDEVDNEDVTMSGETFVNNSIIATREGQPHTPHSTHQSAMEQEVLALCHKLQKGLLISNQEPKVEEIESMSTYITKLEGLPNLEVSIIKQTKIYKVLKEILKLSNIPKEEKF